MVFNLFKRSNKDTGSNIIAPMNGKIVPMEKVPDPVFSQKMMGEGIAIEPEDGIVTSPVNGKIVHVPETKHAVGILAEDGTELLIHVGLETVGLKGKGFELFVKPDEEISVGDKLMEFDLTYITENATSTITPIVITNSADTDKTYEMTNEQTAQRGETVLITMK